MRAAEGTDAAESGGWGRGEGSGRDAAPWHGWEGNAETAPMGRLRGRTGTSRHTAGEDARGVQALELCVQGTRGR